MSDVTTFDIMHNGKLGWTVTVKNEFVKECPNYAVLGLDQLLADHYMFRWLHNPNGPAVIRQPNLEGPNNILPEGAAQFWLDGKHVAIENPDLEEKMRHQWKFKDKLQGVLNESE